MRRWRRVMKRQARTLRPARLRLRRRADGVFSARRTEAEAGHRAVKGFVIVRQPDKQG